MLIIATHELDRRLRAAAPLVQMPPVSRSPWVMVPSREWFETRWNQQWWEYCTGRDLKYLAGSGMCEQFSRAALAELNFDCLETVRAWDPDRRDVHIAAREVFVRIPAGAPLNGVSDGLHSTVLIALTEDGQTWTLWFWEPQNRRLRRFDDAMAGDLELIAAQ